MKIKYRGFDIFAEKEVALGGWDNLYFSVYRVSDGLEVVCDFTECEDTEEEYISYMKDRVDQFISTRGESEGMGDDY